ncbi:protein of unknown function [Thiomonas sp. Bio17B3]|nr:protein of unknown function [Thiomonas sp. Bio17B3]VDY10097.1 protein of unknown function [Thiomonas sp. Sup16B3]VDY14880.1 protein of unknown function [Thiomonas sp. OC7]VDY15942.1 protein of unknown function [Thiomonas sp. CB2]
MFLAEAWFFGRPQVRQGAIYEVRGVTLQVERDNPFSAHNPFETLG